MIHGILAAAITPLKPDFTPDYEAIPGYLDFLACRGCHGALVLGTTGEGPSFSPEQRVEIINNSLRIREEWPDFFLLAGTGTPSLDETARLTRAAFDLGLDGVIIVPPYYYRKAGDEGLFSWYKEIMDRSVPTGGVVLGYHIPAVSGISFSMDLIARLLDSEPTKFIGLKDSSGDSDFAYQLGKRFGNALSVFTGNDRHLSLALQNSASGSITAMANVISPYLRDLWIAFQENKNLAEMQKVIDSVREVCENYQPFPPLIKYLLSKYFEFPHWPVCPPLISFTVDGNDLVFDKLNLA
ncbi:MAG: dihydrodipicolinate synthase family protein [Chloroflexota bacterium]|nr:MAG: dihydrodipicolinate synthase family protein [Chloroflexota bacterium]